MRGVATQTMPRRIGFEGEGNSNGNSITASATSSTSIEGILSQGRSSSELSRGVSLIDRRRAASPLSQVHPVTSSARPPATMSPVGAMASHSRGGSVDESVASPTSIMTSTRSESRSSRRGSTSSSVHGANTAEMFQVGLVRGKSITARMTSPALPDSPLLNAEHPQYNSYASSSGIDGSQAWERTIPPISTAPSYNRSISDGPWMRSSTPNPPVANGMRSPMGGSTIPRSSTPNYLLQRSPSAAGYHSDYDGSNKGNVGVGTNNAAQRPAGQSTRGHASSNSNSSASSAPRYNPLLQSTFDSSSVSSIESVGSSYHSSDAEGEDKSKILITLLYEPDSKKAKEHRKRGMKVASKNTSKVKTNGRDELFDQNGSTHSHRESTESAVGDQEDVLQLLTGLTKKDVATIQQKLFSAAVAKEADDAIRNSSRRRRPSVGSVRELVCYIACFAQANTANGEL